MKIHYLQHEPYESLGCIEDWINKKGYSLSSTKFYENRSLPALNDFDFLIVMGGPMGVYDEDKYPWLKDEKVLIKNSVANNKIVLGICLGSQLLADALGEKVYKNKFKEIGWFPIKIKNSHDFFAGFPSEIEVFHWHGDTFDLPAGALQIAESSVCKNQAFIFNDRVMGLQFHFEVTQDSVKEMVDNGSGELMRGEYIQTAEEIIERSYSADKNNKLMFMLLERLVDIRKE